jgi:hypothetical protein
VSGQIASVTLNRVELVANNIDGLFLGGSGITAGTMRIDDRRQQHGGACPIRVPHLVRQQPDERQRQQRNPHRDHGAPIGWIPLDCSIKVHRRSFHFSERPYWLEAQGCRGEIGDPANSQRRECMAIAQLFFLIILILPAAVLSSSAFAETRVSGTAQAVRLETHDATVGEALAALGATLGLRYSTTSLALNRRVSGVYVGSLGHVVSRLLEGSNFVLKTSPQGVEVVVILDSGATGVQSPNTVPGVPPGQRNPPQPGVAVEQNPNTGAPLPPWLRAARQPN